MTSLTSWTTEFSHALKNSQQLSDFLGWPISGDVDVIYPVFVPQNLATKIKEQGPDGPLAKQFLPQSIELYQNGLIDPIGDQSYSRAPQLIHRYHSRALFTPVTVCPVHCRYCFRKNELYTQEELFQADFEKTLEYLQAHPEISEIIFTGGDPLTLSNEKLRKYLEKFSEIKSIKDLRFHTRFPVIIPQRIDSDLINLLSSFSIKFRSISLVTHVNHVSEFDEASDRIFKDLQDAPIQLLAQTVLLKGVNDNLKVLVDLIEKLIELKVRPYYLHHPDQVKGGMHFSLPLQQGRELYAQLRDLVPGWALPHYVIDIPGGHGKVSAFNPESFEFSGKLIGRSGAITQVQEPDFFS